MGKLGNYINTYTGIKFYILDPSPEDIKIEDIAHALSMICRYGGHCKFFYSVAQHSIGVQETLKRWGYNELIQLYGLLHDASEAYLLDIPRPIKSNVQGYEDIEKELQYKILSKFNLARPIFDLYEIVKKADNAMFKCEVKVLMADWKDWNLPYDDINIEIKNELISDVEQDFFKRIFELSKCI